MSGSVALKPEVAALIVEAADWRLLALLFCRPCEPWREEVRRLSRETRDAVLREAATKAVEEASEGAFHSIFGPGGPAPAREASCQGTLQLGYLLAELRAFYEAFAYRPSTEESGNEPPDHVSVEVGFVSFLRLKQAFAWSQGLASEAAITADAADRFIKEHLSNLGEPLGYALEHSGESYLRLAGQALRTRTGPARKQVFDLLDEEAGDAGGCGFACGASS
jgi:TorA maturation chaperone TorD